MRLSRIYAHSPGRTFPCCSAFAARPHPAEPSIPVIHPDPSHLRSLSFNGKLETKEPRPLLKAASNRRTTPQNIFIPLNPFDCARGPSKTSLLDWRPKGRLLRPSGHAPPNKQTCGRHPPSRASPSPKIAHAPTSLSTSQVY